MFANIACIAFNVPSPSGSPDLPLHSRDADLLPSLLIIVEPLTLCQIHPRKLRIRLGSRGKKLALPNVSTTIFTPPPHQASTHVRLEVHEF
jgi:hypothetical protein